MHSSLQTIAAHEKSILGLAVTADSNTLVSASREGTLKWWDLDHLKQLHVVTAHTGGAFTTTVTPDGRMIGSGGADGTAKVWEIETGRLIKTFPTGEPLVISIGITPSGRKMITAGYQGALEIWDLLTGNRLIGAKVDMPNPGQWPPPALMQVKAVNDRVAITAVWTGQMMEWDLTTGVRTRTFGEQFGHVAAIAVDEDRNLIVSTASELDEPPSLNIWDLRTLKRMKRVSVAHEDRLTCVSLAPNNAWAATGASDSKVKIWDLESETCLNTLDHSEPISSVLFSPDGQKLVTGGARGTLSVWTLAL